MDRGDHGERGNGEGRPGLSGSASGGHAKGLLDLRAGELPDTEEGTLVLDAFLGVGESRARAD